MKILYTGSNGLLGQKLAAATLQYPQHQFLATSRGENRTAHLGSADYASMDIADAEDVLRVVTGFQPDTIIHAAAMTNVDQCELDQEQATLLNVAGTRNIVNAARACGAHLVHLSTDFIFDGADGPYDEAATPNPLSFYGHTKLEAENIVRTLPSWSILRTVLVIGLAEDLSRSNIVLWAKGALEKGQPISVVDDQFRTPTWAEDLAQGTLLAADQSAQGVFNIAGPDYMSIFELVERVAKFYHLSTANVQRVDSTTLNQPAKRPPITGLKIEKAIQELGYRPHSFEEALQKMAEQAKDISRKA